MFFGTPAWMFSWLIPAIVAGATDISVSVHSLLDEAFSVICKDPSHSDSAFISFVLFELVLVSHSYCYTCFIFSTDNAVSFHL